MLDTRLPIETDELQTFCKSHGVAKLLVFGSVLRDDFDASRSDVDLLVEFKQGAHKGLFKLASMRNTLSKMFGREVDLTTPNSLSKYFRNEVMASAVVLYDAA